MVWKFSTNKNVFEMLIRDKYYWVHVDWIHTYWLHSLYSYTHHNTVYTQVLVSEETLKNGD